MVKFVDRLFIYAKIDVDVAFKLLIDSVELADKQIKSEVNANTEILLLDDKIEVF
jgi:hypothetical protein